MTKSDCRLTVLGSIFPTQYNSTVVTSGHDRYKLRTHINFSGSNFTSEICSISYSAPGCKELHGPQPPPPSLYCPSRSTVWACNSLQYSPPPHFIVRPTIPPHHCMVLSGTVTHYNNHVRILTLALGRSTRDHSRLVLFF